MRYPADTFVRLHTAHPFRRRRFFNGRTIRPAPGEDAQRDIALFTFSGEEMTDTDSEGRRTPEGSNTVLTVFLNGDGIVESGPRGQPVVDDSFLLIFNAHQRDVEVTLPGAGCPHRWATVLDTVTGDVVVGTARQNVLAWAAELPAGLDEHAGGETLTVTTRSLLQHTDVP